MARRLAVRGATFYDESVEESKFGIEDTMKRTIRLALALASLLLSARAADAHFNMLLPDKHSIKKGETVTFTYQWGHPFEHQLFDAPKPESVVAIAPDGKKTDLTKTLEKTTIPAAEGKKVVAYNFKFTPDERGDYVLALTTPSIWMAEDEEFFQDTVKVVLHVQAQRGWDATMGGDALEIVPVTRPYGLQAGMVFQAQAGTELKGMRGTYFKPWARTLVEIERYNATAPKKLPPDEHITRAAKTDPGGVVTSTLTESGWWCLTAQRKGGQQERDGKKYPVRKRATLWVYVDDMAK
jgi:cobalt/nickel transport protein